MSHLHPGFLLFATAILVALTRGVWRQLVLLGGTAFALYSAWHLGFDTTLTFAVPGYTLELLRVDALSHVFGLIFSLIAGIGCLYALHVRHGGEHAAALIYAGAALGVVFAGDLITLFVFWELMAVSSLFVIWYGNSARAQAAGLRYLLVHTFGGSLLLCGMLIHVAAGGDLTVQALTSDTHSAAFWLILIGVAINAAIPPLHAWLTDAYPEASVSGSVFLSAFTTKTAVYVLIRLFPGTPILLWFGVIMTLYGVVYAVLANDIRNLLAYHIVSQVGYMVAGVGMGSALALNGSVAHAFCHILYKALLFMGAGSVIYATGKRKSTELGGLARAMPLVLALYMVGAVSISGFPLFNGFISKSIIISAAAKEHLPIAELLLTLASIGTFLSIGLKLPYFTFFGSDRGLQPHRVRSNMLLAMGMAATCCAALGIFPDWLYVRLPFDATYHPYTVDHVVSSLQLLLGTSLGFWWMLAKLKGETAINIDTDWMYRKPLGPAFNLVISMSRQAGATLEAMRLSLNRFLTPYLRNPFRLLMQFGLPPPSPNSTSQTPMAYNENTYRLPIGATVLWIVVCFSLAVLYLLI
jgi:multicomponent Na+:H+ antiporter subunit D